MIRFKNKEYDSIREFDCCILDFKRGERAGYFTILPISSLDYRRNNPTMASVKIKKDELKTDFIIKDDFGEKYVVSIDNVHEKEIEYAINFAKEQGLLKEQTNE